jgi:L-ascorbate metabolism protein UlaG (beta-lactamase superfamily)
MIGFETIGNATVIVYDGTPLFATDPWLSGNAYFGSWGLPYEIPEAQREAIAACPYVWLSHGHPDHLDYDTLQEFRSKTILLPDHVGGRIKDDLERDGFAVRVLPDREWTSLSEHVKVLCIADYSQNAVLLVDVNGRLVVNMNDAMDRGWGRLVRATIRQYPVSFLLKLFSYGDTDMNNFFDEEGRRITPLKRFPLGNQVTYWAELYGAKYVIPFSSFHEYKRTDSIWANEFVDDWPAHRDGLASTRFELLPAFVRYDCERDALEEIAPARREVVAVDPSVFGDDWSEELEPEEIAAVERYFRNFEGLRDHLDFVRIKVGGKEHVVDLAARGFETGVTFEVPRGSLKTAVDLEIFDDLLIGNFMKTTLHGLPLSRFSEPWSMGVAKVGDNGRARTKRDVAKYYGEYRKRAPLEFLLHRLERGSEGKIRRLVPRDSAAFQLAKRVYFYVKRSA